MAASPPPARPGASLREAVGAQPPRALPAGEGGQGGPGQQPAPFGQVAASKPAFFAKTSAVAFAGGGLDISEAGPRGR